MLYDSGEHEIRLQGDSMNLRTLLYWTSGAVLAAGLTGSVLIYRSAAADEEQGYEVIGGFIYPAGGASSKKYVHDLQLYGGKAAVLADDFMRWFQGLWQGTSLAYTVAVLSLAVSFILFLIARSRRVRSPGLCGDPPSPPSG